MADNGNGTDYSGNGKQPYVVKLGKTEYEFHPDAVSEFFYLTGKMPKAYFASMESQKRLKEAKAEFLRAYEFVDPETKDGSLRKGNKSRLLVLGLKSNDVGLLVEAAIQSMGGNPTQNIDRIEEHEILGSNVYEAQSQHDTRLLAKEDLPEKSRIEEELLYV